MRLVGADLLVVAGFAVLVQAASSPQFLWKKQDSRGVIESYGVELNGNGSGQFHFQRRDQDEIRQAIVLKPSAIEALRALFRKADFLEESRNFISNRKVAYTGTKTVRFEDGTRRREVVYDYTEDRTLQEITNFFENLCQQERALFEMDLALRYDRLGIPKKLDELDRNLGANRIVAPERFAPILEKIHADQTLMNLARKEAKRLLSKLEKMQSN